MTNIQIALQRMDSPDGTLEHEFRCPCGLLVNPRRDAHYEAPDGTQWCSDCADTMALNQCEACRVYGIREDVPQRGDDGHAGEAYCVPCAARAGLSYCNGCGLWWPHEDVAAAARGEQHCFDCRVEVMLATRNKEQGVCRTT